MIPAPEAQVHAAPPYWSDDAIIVAWAWRLPVLAGDDLRGRRLSIPRWNDDNIVAVYLGDAPWSIERDPEIGWYRTRMFYE